ncbi:hypothetical protein [Kitasatospora acidiphila]|uniref:hypothetical protein n=1 Tax=Kitasatospora acidiphila TaxID=2567942 RepID=UPI0015EFF58C|nr:hypothetical protein [Kitasatospora acidiphila]
MAVIAVVGGLGAPGATTSALALLLAWPLADGRKVLLVECDPDGGAALAGALEGRVEAVYGLRNLAVADRRGLLAEALWEQLIDVSPGGTGDRLLLPGLTDPAQAAGLAYTWEPLVEMLRGLHTQGYDVLLDLGRSGAHGPGAVLARRADCVAATIRTTLRGLSTARPRLAALREDLAAAGNGADGLGLLLVTEGPYPAADVTRELQLPVHGELPYAPRPARVLSDGGDSTDRRFIRSELMRAARTVADRLLAVAQERRRRLTPAQASAGPEWEAPQLRQAPGWGEQPQVPAWGEPQPVAHAPEVSDGFQGYAAGGYQQPEPSEGYQGYAAAGGYRQPEPGHAAGAGAGDGWGGPVPGTTDAATGEPAVAPPYGGASRALEAEAMDTALRQQAWLDGGARRAPEAEAMDTALRQQAWLDGGARRAPEAEAMDTALRQQAWPDGWAPTVRGGQEQPAATPQGRDAGIAGLARVVGDYALEPPPAPARAEEPAARSWLDGAAVPTGGAAELTPVPPGLVPGVPAAGQAFASPAGQVFVPQAGPVQVRPGATPYPPATAGAPPLAGVAPHPAVPYPPPTAGAPPLAGVAPHPAVPYPPPTAGAPSLAGIAPHPAAPEPFPAPTEETETQGEVLRAR